MEPADYPSFTLSWAASNVDRVSIDGPGTKDFSNLPPSGISDPIQFDCSNAAKAENFMLVVIGSDGKQVTRGLTVTNTGVVPDPQPDPEPTEDPEP